MTSTTSWLLLFLPRGGLVLVLLPLGLDVVSGVFGQDMGLFAGPSHVATLFAVPAGEEEAGDNQGQDLGDLLPVGQLGVKAKTGKVEADGLEDQELQSNDDAEAGMEESADGRGEEGVVTVFDDIRGVPKDDLGLDVVPAVAVEALLEGLEEDAVLGGELGGSFHVVSQHVPSMEGEVAEEKCLKYKSTVSHY